MKTIRLKKATRNSLVSILFTIIIVLVAKHYPTATQFIDMGQTPAQPTKRLSHLAQPGFYNVTKFVDGDTIVVDMDGQDQIIRFIGVDTPEKNDPRKPVQCFAKLASEHTKSLIGNNPVRLEADPLSDNRDRYDRLLRYIYNSDNILVNKQIIADGYGFTVTAFPFDKMEEFRVAQVNARKHGRGLWGKCQVSYPKGYPQTNAITPAPKD